MNTEILEDIIITSNIYEIFDKDISIKNEDNFLPQLEELESLTNSTIFLPSFILRYFPPAAGRVGGFNQFNHLPPLLGGFCPVARTLH